ncbi:MAG: winged helix-turn-helix domain-containing protein [Nitrososphaerales archaeon]
MKRRSRLEIYMDVLVALLDGPKNPTKLMYATNLSWVPVQECLNVLINRGLVQESRRSYRRRIYTLTQTGSEMIGRYKDFLKELAQTS